MDISEADIAKVKTILKKIPYEAIAFGSRVVGNARKDSDLDLCLKNGEIPIPLAKISEFREQFENSSLPFLVDLVDYYYLSEEFKKIVNRTGILFSPCKF